MTLVLLAAVDGDCCAPYRHRLDGGCWDDFDRQELPAAS